MVTVEVERRVDAPVETVWARYSDHVGWTEWAGLGRVRLGRQGEPHRDGVGCVRIIRNMGREITEEVVAFEPPHRLEYSVRKGIPLRDHLGEVTMTSEDGGGTLIVWRCRFRTITGFNAFSGWMIHRVFARTLGRLAKDLARNRATAS